MEPVTQLSFPFGDLPIELALLILKYAAQPSFSQSETYKSQNPYSSALAICLVSKEVRKMVLPEILHTVLLPQLRNVTAFVNALRMQQAYALQDHQFKFDYTKHIRRMWMGQFRNSALDLSLLAPVLLAAPSISVDFENLDLLSGCLLHAWNSRVDNHEGSPPLYSPKTLMVTGTESMTRQWSSFIKSVHGAAFLASITHVISVTHTITDCSRHLCRICRDNGLKNYNRPDWMTQTPLNNLQTFSLPIPHSALPLVECELSGTDMKVELLTFSVSKLSQRPPSRLTHMRVLQQMRRSPNDSLLAVSRHGTSSNCVLCQDWLKAWACGLGS